MALPATAYANASRTAVGPLTDFTIIVNLANLPLAWRQLVDTSDGTKGRASKEDETELAVDWISFINGGGGAVTGWARVKWSGTLSGAVANTIRIYPPVAANASVAAGDAFGAFSAFDSDLITYLSLDEAANTGAGGYASRTGSNDGTGTAMGEASVAGQVGDAADFDGTDDFITITDDAAFPRGADERTISFWFNTDTFNASDNDVMISYSFSGPNGGRFQVIAEDQAVAVQFRGHRRITPKTTLSTGTWYLCTVVVPSGATTTDDVLIYIDGVNQSLSDEAGSVKPLNTSAQNIGIAADSSGSRPTSCRIDDVQIRDTGWSADEAAEEFAATDDNATYWGAWTLVEVGAPPSFDDDVVELTVVMAQEQALEVVMAQEEDLEVVMAQEEALTVVI